MRSPVDQAARDRILTDLDTNLLVEAGAGSGKTTSLVGRMLALVRRGTPVERIAAVTFTRKAAAELRERFEVELEKSGQVGPGGGEEIERLRVARDDIDRAFIGTIHSFAARLLREHPLEAGIDPGFEEIGEEEWPEIRLQFWNRWLERQRRSGGEMLEQLRALGIDPRVLFDGFQTVVRFPDVAFPAPAVPAPDCRACLRELEALMERTRRAMPSEEPKRGWDNLQRGYRGLLRHRRLTDWRTTRDFCDALGTLNKKFSGVTQYHWGSDKPAKAEAKALSVAWAAFRDGPAHAVLTTWREHRYHHVMRALQAAATEFARERRATGRLGFEDLLLGSATLLRDAPSVRRSLGLRYRHLLVDEFQDTDPIQAELCFLLASEPEQGNDWRRVTPRPGALFVVGDPKQSIYRFRRADIQTYELVKSRIAACGDVLGLVENFRSVKPIETLVDDYFRHHFPAKATNEQAAFAPLRTRDDPAGPDGVFVYPVSPASRGKPDVVAACAETVASWIERRIAEGGCQAGDFLILTTRKDWLRSYAEALSRRNIPATMSGGSASREIELRELTVVLGALADPTNPVQVAAALEGLFFGLSPSDLYHARSAGMDFSIAHPPAERESPTGRALAQLHLWWIAAQRRRPDMVIERILDDTGLLAYAAGQPLGDTRAGSLLRLVDSLRSNPGLTLTGAIEAVDLLLQGEWGDASLLPGRADAVRVMNLHKAKGLEARIVILAAPASESEHDIHAHVNREASGRATGGLRICRRKSARETEILAQPPGWTEMESTEARFLAAERERLRYVAATRARRELVIAALDHVGAHGPSRDLSFWAPLMTAARRVGQALPIARTEAPGRRSAALPVEQIAAAASAADARRTAASRAGFSMVTVTESAKEARELERAYDLRPSGGRGAGWGRALHRALEGMARGRRGESLRDFVRAVAREEHRGDDPETLAEASAQLLAVLERARESAEWRRFEAADVQLIECPVVQVTVIDGKQMVVEGVADLAIREGGAWSVLDWKSDDVGDEAWEARRPAYERQVSAYATMLAGLTGEAALGALIRVRPD